MRSCTLAAPSLIRIPVVWVERCEWQEGEEQLRIDSFKINLSACMLLRWDESNAPMQR